MLSSSLSDERLSELKEAFSTFDIDGDGTIDASELAQVLRDLGQPATDTEIRDLLAVADTDDNGIIDFEEFSTMMQSTKFAPSGAVVTALPKGEEIRNVFHALDKNRDGRISMEDLRQIIASIDWKNDRPPNDTDIGAMLSLAFPQLANPAEDDDRVDPSTLTVDLAAFHGIVSRFDTAAAELPPLVSSVPQKGKT
mmetsp:Transcript_80551/g.93978  ORF Transcript_80551/g.93978 Transcript_80551/m.93978 type:complete len:196 (+) Transcript_80551:33-620(+)